MPTNYCVSLAINTMGLISAINGFMVIYGYWYPWVKINVSYIFLAIQMLDYNASLKNLHFGGSDAQILLNFASVDECLNGLKEFVWWIAGSAMVDRLLKMVHEKVMESLDYDNQEHGSRPLVKEICATCGNHDSKEKTWMMFPRTNIFARVPFHAADTISEKGPVKASR